MVFMGGKLPPPGRESFSNPDRSPERSFGTLPERGEVGVARLDAAPSMER